MKSGEVDGGGLVVAGGEAAPLLELVDAAFYDVALLAGLAVEGERTGIRRLHTVRGLNQLRDHSCGVAVDTLGDQSDATRSTRVPGHVHA
ncbi:hypothetical protein [Streptomyces sp. T12]|uniref:hypothetical protein n=1 Tax=Streptomyces sp. T12 TaxID=477697 RepID=UPI001C98634C